MEKIKQFKRRILSVRVERVLDTNPDLSWIGKYSDEYREGAFDIEAHGHATSNSMTYWIPGPNHFPHNPKSWDHVSEAQVNESFDKLPQEWKDRYVTLGSEFPTKQEILDQYYVECDYLRMISYDNGEWCMYGIIAKAVVQLTGDLTQTIRSGGLWGIESDSDESYMKSVEEDELNILRIELIAMGFKDRQITYAFQNVERKD